MGGNEELVKRIARPRARGTPIRTALGHESKRYREKGVFPGTGTKDGSGPREQAELRNKKQKANEVSIFEPMFGRFRATRASGIVENKCKFFYDSFGPREQTEL